MASARAEEKAQDAGKPAAAGAEWLGRYQRMLQIRLFEQEIQRLFLAGEVHGTTHLCAGQEAVHIGVADALQTGDWVAGTYRGHGHALAVGSSPERLAAEMLGRESGTCGGRAGSMNVVDLEHGLIGCFGIVGGSAGAATGAALSAKRNGAVAVAFFGDGATNHGYVFECLNFARVLTLPVVFVCENNLYGEFTPMEHVTAGGDISARVAGFDVPAHKVDGNDVWAVHEAALAAVERARAGEGPAFLECLTYRHFGHSRSDPGDYRPKDEVEQWRARDPLTLARQRLEQNGMEAGEIDTAEQHVREELDAAIAAARDAPYPDPEAQRATEYST